MSAGSDDHRQVRGHDIELTINDEAVSATVPAHTTLVELLREELDLTGTTEGCGVGVCGCCTVLVDGQVVASCLELAINANGKEVRTVEGLADTYPAGRLHPLQETFQDHEGFQCGYCTPGMLMSSKALLDEHPDPSREEIKAYLSENLCRCTGYAGIISAVEAAADELGSG